MQDIQKKDMNDFPRKNTISYNFLKMDRVSD